MREHLEDLIAQMRGSGMQYETAVSEFRKAFVSAALRANSGNMCKAAEAMGVHRNTLARICSEVGIEAREFRSERRSPASARASLFVKRPAR